MVFKKKPRIRYGRKVRIRVRRAYRKRRAFVNPRSRLSGAVKMPYFKYARCYDGTPLQLKASNEVAAGFWCDEIKFDFNNIPGAPVFKEIYRFFKIKKIITEYTPAMRSDEYSKLFAWPTGGAQELYNAGGGALEIKHLRWLGYESSPVDWASVLNRAGKLRKCATTKSFRYTSYPLVKQILADTVAADPTRFIRAPWLSTEDSEAMSLDHYTSIDCWHTMNDTSFDNSQPLYINQRFSVEIEFKGLKI